VNTKEPARTRENKGARTKAGDASRLELDSLETESLVSLVLFTWFLDIDSVSLLGSICQVLVVDFRFYIMYFYIPILL
jgi:hypothetical protein